MATEEWRPISFTGGFYEASNHGRIRRAVTSKGARAGRVLRVRPNNRGYLLVQPCVDGKYINTTVHVCVADAFLGPRPEGMETNHRNGDKVDNRPENLEYVTGSQNMRHAFNAGFNKPPILPPEKIRRGQECNFSKLREPEAREIHRRYNVGENPGEIASEFGVTRYQVIRIGTGRSWKHLSSSAAQGVSPACHAQASGHIHGG